MYQEFYGLRKDPFSLNPDLDFLYESSVHEEAIAHLVYGLEQKEDIIFIAGDIGTGKTLALHRLLEQLSPSVQTVSINVTTIGFEELVRLILLKLDCGPETGKPIAGLLHQLEQELIRLRKHGRSVLLVIDEAQNLSLESLESVRLLLNLAQPGGQVLQIVLTGQLGLKAKLETHQLRQLRQRIKVSYTFGTLSRAESDEYILHRLRRAGRDKELFRRDALEEIYQLSRGVPRIVNYLASKALLSGYVAEAKTITAKHVEENVVEIEALLGRTVTEETNEAVATSSKPPTKEPLSPESSPVRQEPRLEPRPEPDPPMATRRSDDSRRRGAWIIVVAVLLLVIAAFFTSDSWMPLIQKWAVRADANESTPVGSGPHTEVGAQEEPDGLAGTNEPVRTDAARQVPREATGTGVAAGETVSGPRPLTERTSTLESTSPEREATENPNEEAAPATEPDMESQAPVQPLEPVETVPPTRKAVAVPLDSFVVHVASFQDAARASNFRNRLLERGLQAFVQDAPYTSRRAWHRVYIGPYAGHDRAAEVVAELKADGTITYSQITKR